ncbi:MAG: RNA polymerase sigma factor [Candidatus Aphodosoma sp.]
MTNNNIYDTTDLNRFASTQWRKALAFLKNRFGIDEDDCKDIFQESFIILYNNIQAGKLDNMNASLSTYFMSICRNKALEFLRGSSKSVNVDSETSLSLMDGEVQSEKIEALLALDNGDEIIEAQKEELVRTIVKDLPSPCNELLWGFYRDNLSMKSLAEMFNYSSEGVVKVTKHRCCEKFRARYNELCNKLF